ncbi:MAG: hypothetical protein UY40_C0002G0049 [candidate division CPR1 bacterium GW2011_GWC1_49_13]|uniref:Sulfatase N-terminal domain-containing protein n=1 Tax=candidate division CPR1 bacterium GW2011_GWC1_49_13 TaxID=1618342 RepID=A0A0G1YIH3_9BACT|nr:MAG: hypothetical protein UY40_C0002G0049 [candidate division CPR1 bacterium GW2011_GWC1_49_13]
MFFKLSTPTKRIFTFPVHPFLFAAFPIFSIYYSNIAEVYPFSFWKPLVVSFSLAVLLFSAFKFIFRDRQKAGLTTLVALVIVFTHGHIHNFIGSSFANFFDQGNRVSLLLFTLGIDDILFLVWGIVFLIFFTVIYRTKGNLTSLIKGLNFTFAVLLVIPLFGSFYYEAANLQTRILRKSSSEQADINLVGGEIKRKPDIYYIILDRYASNRTLKDFYNFDNRYFTDFLEEKGFYVAYDALSNYPRTLPSLAAALNMDYINYLSNIAGEDTSDQTFAYPLVDHHKVGETLKSLGYKYIHLGSWFEPTKVSSVADQNLLLGDIYLKNLDGLSTEILNTTIFAPLIRKFLPGTSSESFAIQHANRILYQFDQVKKIAEVESDPKFVFAHILIPHPPFVFNESCQVAPGGGVWAEDTVITGYTDQLTCGNQLIMAMVEEILQSANDLPIIVIQADEGPYARRYPMLPGRFNFKEASDNTLKERFGILNALYLPGIGAEQLYPELSQVNTFRVIFRNYFGADLENLPDKSYIYADEDHFYKYSEVTNRLR